MPSFPNWLLLMTPCGDKLYHLAEEECMQCCSDSKSHATLFTFKAQALLLLLLLLLCSEAVCLFAWLQGGLLYALLNYPAHA